VTILDKIIEHKKGEVEVAKSRICPGDMRARAEAVSEAPRGFRRALVEGEAPAVIAEVKRRSPSKGEIRSDFEPVLCAQAYHAGGAAALSVLTDEHFFGGHLDYLAKIRAEVSLPILRKDFTIDAYQIDEARSAGADAILLIAKALSTDVMPILAAHARGIGLDVLVEVHDEAELERALDMNADLIGVNNRNLATFETDLGVTERLAGVLNNRNPGSLRSDIVLVGESGIRNRADVARLEAVGARAFLVGESLMREKDLVRALNTLRRGP
jgi:indole-3-glycerol phosphate synthase